MRSLRLPQKKLSERKKNKLQGAQDDQSTVPLGPQFQVDVPTMSRNSSNERRAPKMKWDPLSKDEGELHNFFEELRNSLHINIAQEKAIKLLNEHGNDAKSVLESVNANKDKYAKELATTTMN